jgi:hypothetical protein
MSTATSEGEMTMQWIVAWGLVAVAASALAAVLAGFKNRDYSYWMAWCFVVPPLVLWLLMLPKNKGERPRQPRLDDIDRRENGPL